MATDDKVLNAVLGQKVKICARIDLSHSAEGIEHSLRLIDFALPLWEAVGHGYEARELRERAAKRAEHLIAVEREYLAGCRKNDRTRHTTEAEIARLESLAG
jgi:hypothetical protein